VFHRVSVLQLSFAELEEPIRLVQHISALKACSKDIASA